MIGYDVVIILVRKEFVQDVMFTVSRPNRVKQYVIGILLRVGCKVQR